MGAFFSSFSRGIGRSPCRRRCFPSLCEQAGKILSTQRAGARRRSPRSGSAAAGAHIARAQRGKMRADGPLRRAVGRGHVIRQRRPPPHGQGSMGVVGGVEGPAPLTPCRPPRRRPRPDAGQQPPASGEKKREKPQTGRAGGNVSPWDISKSRRMIPRRSACVRHAGEDASRRCASRPERSSQPSEPGRGGDPRAAGAPQQARISPVRSAGRCAPTAPCGERWAGDTSYGRDGLHHTDKGVWGS